MAAQDDGVVAWNAVEDSASATFDDGRRKSVILTSSVAKGWAAAAKLCASRRIALTVWPSNDTPRHWKPPSLLLSIMASCLFETVECVQVRSGRLGAASGFSAPDPGETGHKASTSAALPAKAMRRRKQFPIAARRPRGRA